MTRALICTGVLGGGTAVVFALAFLAAALFPHGGMVPAGFNGGWNVAQPMPMVGGAIGGGWATNVITDASGNVTTNLAVPVAVPAPVPAAIDTPPPDDAATDTP